MQGAGESPVKAQGAAIESGRKNHGRNAWCTGTLAGDKVRLWPPFDELPHEKDSVRLGHGQQAVPRLSRAHASRFYALRASASQSLDEPKNTLRSSCPPQPGSLPVEVYCQMVGLEPHAPKSLELCPAKEMVVGSFA